MLFRSNTFTDGDTAYVIADIDEIEYNDAGIYRIRDDGAIELFYPKLSSSASSEVPCIEAIEPLGNAGDVEPTQEEVETDQDNGVVSPWTILFFLIPALILTGIWGMLVVKRRKP